MDEVVVQWSTATLSLTSQPELDGLFLSQICFEDWNCVNREAICLFIIICIAIFNYLKSSVY